ncbi:hypothetical protein L7F22_034688 [Adiantum nelumboides]|nr:hypothetical protein [Adiantum nelumboides]
MCATEEEYIPILQQAHSGQAGGHFSAEKMAKSILYAGIWWPTLFMDAEEFVKRCDDCQRTKTLRGRDDMPLRSMMRAIAFAKWGIDFVGPIAPLAYKSHAQYIIVAIDYLTKWVEAKATTKNDAKTTAQFLYENIFTRYGLPIEIVSDRGTHFINEVTEQLLDEFMVIHCKSAPYHPQANGQAESTNKILVTVLTKIVSESRTDWDQKLHLALWAYRVAYKTSIGMTPFDMVYGIQAILSLEFLIPTLRVAKELEWTGHELSEQLEVLEKLDETRLRAVASIYAQKRNMKSFFDQHVINKEFATGDYVLMYTLKQHSKKLQKRGNGPYVIHDISPSGAIKLATLEGEEMPNWISGCRLKKYHLPLTTEMLAKIHSAKERKNKLKETKAQAQEEAQIRIFKRKQKLQQQRQPPIEETTPVPLAANQSCEQWQIGIDVRINVKLPNGQYQKALDEAMARVKAGRKELADARAAKVAKTARPMTMEEARKIKIEKAKAIQKERRRIEADKKAQEEDEVAQAAQIQEREVIDLSGTVEYLKKLEREKNTAKQRAVQLAREKIKEALSRKAEEPVLEPTQGSPKRPRQEEEKDIEHIQADPIPPSPINIPPAPPSSPITPFPPASTPQTPPSPSPLDIPKSPPAPTSPQQQPFSVEPFEIPTSLLEETTQSMDKIEEEKQTDGKQHQPTDVDVPILIIQENEPTNEEAIQEVKSFDYTRLIQTLSRQFKCQQVVAKETEIQKDRANQAQEEITNLKTALELVTQERDTNAKENENLLRDLIDLQSQLTRKEAQNHELIKNEKKMKDQLKYEDTRFQKLTASYNTVKNTLTALLQNQELAAAIPSTSDSAAANTLAALQEELQREKLHR